MIDQMLVFTHKHSHTEKESTIEWLRIKASIEFSTNQILYIFYLLLNSIVMIIDHKVAHFHVQKHVEKLIECKMLVHNIK